MDTADKVKKNLKHKTLRSADDFVTAQYISQNDSVELIGVEERYATAMSPHMQKCVETSHPSDPVLRQFLPSTVELQTTPLERADPIGDNAHSPVKGIVHRYSDRVLFKITPVCPVYCRFCFRREMVGPGKENALNVDEIKAAIAYIESQPDIWEVIFTGGDPFMLSAKRVKDLVTRLNAIKHVKIVRWHTRMPVADPDRIDDDYVAALSTSSNTNYVVVHANHANEFSPAVKSACQRMMNAGITLLSQSVLLRGVNDTLPSLTRLMRTFVEHNIKPYQLHQLDFAPGTSHFRVSIEEGQSLIQQLRDTVSGLCIPTYVIDIPGGISKAIASPSDMIRENDQILLRGRDGQFHDYP